MGVVGVAIATLAGGYLQGRAQKKAYEQQAATANANAQIAYQNAEQLQEQAEVQAKNNALNEEVKRRKVNILKGQQRAALGAAGIQASGSALNVMADSAYNAEMDMAIERWNGRQKVDNYFNASNDSYNQGNVYKWNADQYKKAGNKAIMNSMLQSGLKLAGSLYTPKSEAVQKANPQSYGNDGTGYGWGKVGKDYSLNQKIYTRPAFTW